MSLVARTARALVLGTGERYLLPMIAHTLQPLVDRLCLRSVLNQEEQQAILALPTESEHVLGRHDLISLGEQTQSSYLVVSGIIGRFSQMRDGGRQIVALHIPGDMADLCSVALPKTSWAFHALAPSLVMGVRHADLIAIADDYPNIAMAFWRDCVADMAVMSEWIVSVARRSSEAKLAHLLCEMHCRYKQAGLLASDGSYAFPVTQAQIAEILGITAIHVNRMVRSLRESGLATIARSTITIIDLPGLTRLAEFNAAYLHLGEQAA